MPLSDSINWEKYFDRVFVIIYAPNWHHKERLDNELKRVGLLGSSILEWKITVPCVYDSLIVNSYEDKKYIHRIGWVNESLALLDILEESRILRYNRILVLEEDVCFLKDLVSIERHLSVMPVHYDTIQFDHGFAFDHQRAEWEGLLSKHKINDMFVDSNHLWFGMGTVTVFYKTGIEKAISVLSNKPIAIDTIPKFSNEKRALSIAPLAIQVCYKESVGGRVVGEKFYWPYERANIEFQDYNLPFNPEKRILI